MPAINDISTYISSIKKHNKLSVEDEYSIAIDFVDNGNLDSARKLVLSHLRFVIHIAKSYSGYHLPMNDIIQEGNIGLLKAIKAFDPRKGIKLISFAVHWIKAEIHEYVIKNFRLGNVATTKAQRKLFFNLKKEKNLRNRTWLNANDRKRISDKLNVPEFEINNMEQRLYTNDHFLGVHGSEDNEGSNYFELTDESQDDIANSLSINQEKEILSNKLTKEIAALPEREKHIIESRYLQEKKTTLSDLSAIYNVSMERIRQIEANTLKKLNEKFN
jgi:RNA polymerase sigma-32 factor